MSDVLVPSSWLSPGSAPIDRQDAAVRWSVLSVCFEVPQARTASHLRTKSRLVLLFLQIAPKKGSVGQL